MRTMWSPFYTIRTELVEWLRYDDTNGMSLLRLSHWRSKSSMSSTQERVFDVEVVDLVSRCCQCHVVICLAFHIILWAARDHYVSDWSVTQHTTSSVLHGTPDVVWWFFSTDHDCRLSSRSSILKSENDEKKYYKLTNRLSRRASRHRLKSRYMIE